MKVYKTLKINIIKNVYQMKKVKFPIQQVFRLLALLLCLNATVPQLSAAMYIVGSRPFGDWSTNDGMPMTQNGSTYTATATVSGTIYFVFATQLCSTKDDWTTFAGYRLGPSSNNYNVTVGNTYNAYSGNSNSYMFTGNGNYVFTYDTSNNTFVISEQAAHPTYYITGDNGLGLGGFSYAPSTTMVPDANYQVHTYTYNVTTPGTYYFAFADGPGSSWNDFNTNHRYGPTSGNQTATLNGSYAPTQRGEGSYSVTVGTGQVTIYLDASNTSSLQYRVEGPSPVVSHDYYVKGDSTSIFPDGWSTSSNTAQMTNNNDGTYSWTSAQFHLQIGTSYGFKVYCSDGSWHPLNSGNQHFSGNDPGTYTVTVTYDSNNETVTSELTLIQADQTYDYTFYVLPDDGTTTPTLYLWGAANNSYHPNGDWAGTAMSDTEELADGNTWYKYTGSLYANLMNAIVNNGDGNGHQTSDITNLAPGTYYIRWNVNANTHTITTDAPEPAPTYDYTICVRYKGSATPSMYLWDAHGQLLGDFPGTALTDAAFTTQVINGYTYYIYTVTGSSDPSLNMILNEGSSQSQTSDLTVSPGTSYYTYSGGSTLDGPKAEADPAITYYAENSFIGWTTDGTQMTADGNGGYSKTFTGVALNRGTTYSYKVYGADGTNGGVWIGVNGGDGTFTVPVSGTYTVTITLNSDGTISHSYEMTQAASLYIIGSEGLGLNWSYAPETAMTYDAATGYYTYTTNVTAGGIYNFVFGNGQGTDWGNFNSNYRIGPTGSNDQAITPDGNWNSTQMAAGSNSSYSINILPGDVTITFDPVNMQFKVNGQTNLYNYTFYVLPSDNQTVPYIYLWGLGTDEAYSNSFPGTQLTTTEVLADGNTWYKLSVDLTVEYIHAMINGGDNDSKTRDITHIDPGTYYIYWSTQREPGESYNDYTLTNVAPTETGGTLFMIGTYYYDKQQYHYEPNRGVQFKYDANTHTYYLNNVSLAVNNTFCFTSQLSDEWANVGPRYGNSGSNGHVVGQNVTNYFDINEDYINKKIPIDYWSDDNGEFRMSVPGIYNVLVNVEEMWVKLIKTDYYELTPMNVFLEQTPNVVMTQDGNNFIQEPGTEYSTSIFGNSIWPLAAYNGTHGGYWDPNDGSHFYPVTYVGDTITTDGKKWWHWQVEASIAEVFFTRLNEPCQSDTIKRKAGVLWVTWDEVNGQATLTDHSREYFEAAANALPTNAVVMEGHYYVYFINTVDWDKVYCYAWDNDSVDNVFHDGYSRLMSSWPGQRCELVGIDPVTGYEVWRYDFGTIIGTGLPSGILFNDGNTYAETEAKEQTGDFEYVNGAVYDYLGMVDGAFTLNNLIRKAAKEVRYTVSNDLLAVYYDKDAVTPISYLNAAGDIITEDIHGALYAKDLNLYGEKSIKPDASYTDYIYDICASDHTPGRSQVMIKKTSYDQSNWVKLVISPNYDNGKAVVPKDERPDLSVYENHIIPAGSLDVFMTDTINPTAHVLKIKMGDEMKYEPNVYISSHFNDTTVFHFTHQDWLGPDAEYKPNYGCQPVITWLYNESTGEVTGGIAERHPDFSDPKYMFYVAPKPQEIAYITWVVYDNYNEDEVWGGYVHGEYHPVTTIGRDKRPDDPGRFYTPKNWNRTIYLDASAYPNLSQVTEASELEKALGAWSPEYGPYSNGYQQYGGIKVNWSLFDEEASGGPWWQIIKPGQAYKFKAIIRYARGSGFTDNPDDVDDTADNYYYQPSNGYLNVMDSTQHDPGRVFNAPRRAVDSSTGFANMYFTDYDNLDQSKFIIFPIEARGDESNGNDMGNVTTVKEVTSSRSVVGVSYFNLMGVHSDKPFEGINIIVTTYSDGSRTSRKVLMR